MRRKLRSRARSRLAGLVVTLRSLGGMLATQVVVVLLTLPASMLVARLLGPDELGRFLTAQRICTIVMLLVHLSAAHGYSYIAAGTDDPNVLGALYRSTFKFSAVTSIAAASISISVALLQGDPLLVRAMLAMVFFLPAFLYVQLLSAIFRGQMLNKQFNVLRVVQPFAWLVFAVTLFLTDYRNVIIVGALYAITHVSTALVAVFLGTRQRWPKVDHEGIISRVIRYSLRGHFGQAGSEINIYLDQVLLSFLLPFREVGLYGVAANTASAVSGVSTALTPIVQPMVQRAKPTDRKKVALSLLVIGPGLLGCLVLILYIPMPELIELVYGAEYRSAAAIARVLLLAILIESIANVSGAILFGLNRPGVTSWATAGSLACGIALLLVLVPVYGIEGAAWASVLSYLVGASIKLTALLRSL